MEGTAGNNSSAGKDRAHGPGGDDAACSGGEAEGHF